MNTASLTILFTCIQFNVQLADAQITEWAKKIGGPSDEVPYSVCTDFAGNILITGFFQSPTITIGTTILTNTTVCSNCYDIFLAKYDDNGNVLWAKSAGGGGMDVPGSVATDDSGNIYLTGSFTGYSITFDTTILFNHNSSREDIFVVKFDPNGNLVWAKAMGGSYDDKGFSISVDQNQYIYFCGQFSSNSVIFGLDTLHNLGLGVQSDLFISKYDLNGNEIWAKSTGGYWHDQANSITTDLAGNIFVTGFFWSDTIRFDNIIIVNTDAAQGSDIFLVKYSPDGNAIWAKIAGGAYTDEALSLVTDMNSNLLVTGYFRSINCTFGSHVLNSHNLDRDIFIAKYDSSGLELWAKGAICHTDAVAHAISVDQFGNSYTVGEFADTIVFDSDTIYNISQGKDIFIARYNTNGDVEWVKGIGGVPSTAGGSVYAYAACFDMGKIYIGGLLRDSCLILGQDTIYNSGGWDALLIKLDTTLTVKVSKDKIEQSHSGLSPNPFHITTNLTLKQEFVKPELRIYNSLGQEVRYQKISSETTIINRDGLSNGVYIYQVISSDGKISIGRMLID